jgi:uncharacterized protein YbgA (DUF1722 family)
MSTGDQYLKDAMLAFDKLCLHAVNNEEGANAVRVAIATVTHFAKRFEKNYLPREEDKNAYYREIRTAMEREVKSNLVL